MLGCHETLETFEWKMMTARSSDATTSQIQSVLGASSSLLTRRVEELSKLTREQPPFVSDALPDVRAGGYIV
jgi:hypothetical protein